MRKPIAFVCATLFAASFIGSTCRILQPPSGPGTAYPCGLNSHMCSDGMCCGDGYECTVDRLPIYADPPGHGFCTWGGKL